MHNYLIIFLSVEISLMNIVYFLDPPKNLCNIMKYLTHGSRLCAPLLFASNQTCIKSHLNKS